MFPSVLEQQHSQAGPQSLDIWQPTCPFGYWGTEEVGTATPRWKEGPLLPPAWHQLWAPRHAVLLGSLRYQGCCAAGEPHVPRDAVLLGEPQVPRDAVLLGSLRYPGMLCCYGTGELLVLWNAAQLVASKHHLPIKHPPPLPCQAAASPGCITDPWATSSQMRSCSSLWVAEKSKQHPCLHPDCVWCWLWPHSPQPINRQASSQLQHTAMQWVRDASFPAQPRAAHGAHGCGRAVAGTLSRRLFLLGKHQPWGSSRGARVLADGEGAQTAIAAADGYHLAPESWHCTACRVGPTAPLMVG